MEITRVTELPVELNPDTIYLELAPSGRFQITATGTADANLVLKQTQGTIFLDQALEITYDLLPVQEPLDFEFKIVNFDAFRNYTVSSSTGTIVLGGLADTFDVKYTVTTFSGPQTFTINGQLFEFEITVNGVRQPSITNPANGATQIPTTGQTFTSSAFEMDVNPGDVWTHESSDWQIATDAGFTNIVQESLNDTVNLTTWTPV